MNWQTSKGWIEIFEDIPLWYILAAVLTCLAFVVTQSALAFAPLGLLFAATFLLADINRIYLALFLFIPLSTEVYLPMGLGTDVPTEQFMWMLTGLGFLLFLFNWRFIPAAYLMNGISLLLMAMLGWTLVATVFSTEILQSFKYFLARIWYLVAMYGMTLYLVRDKHDVNRVFKYLFFGLIASVLVIMIRHGLQGFTYDSINFVLWPFYRNHVNYACLLAICLPLYYWYVNSRQSQSYRRIGRCVFIVLLVALYFTYTRAAIIASVCVPVFYVIVRWKMVIPALALVMVTAGIGVANLVQKYNYLEYAPNYATTIQHGNFDDVLSATYRLEDLSTMERFYRWVAGYHMFREKPLTGFGPANFYTSYRPFTVTAFTTYVSDNPDQSGIHNYYLMLLVEQGIPGLLLFIALVVCIFYLGQNLYHRIPDKIERGLVLAALGSIVITLIISLMNDMLETDKVGTIFLFCVALIVRSYVRSRDQNSISN